MAEPAVVPVVCDVASSTVGSGAVVVVALVEDVGSDTAVVDVSTVEDVGSDNAVVDVSVVEVLVVDVVVVVTLEASTGSVEPTSGFEQSIKTVNPRLEMPSGPISTDMSIDEPSVMSTSQELVPLVKSSTSSIRARRALRSWSGRGGPPARSYGI